jgi:drug/metabolite transporter (DMT)-like permease
MMRFLFLLASTLVVLALVTHLSTFVGVDPHSTAPGLWYFLQIGSAVCLAVSLILIRNKGDDQGPEESRFLAALALVLFFAIAYAVFTFMFTGIVLGENARPAVVDGQYALVSHGNTIRLLSEADFIRQQIYQARISSGHWMCFFLMGTLAFYLRAVDK